MREQQIQRIAQQNRRLEEFKLSAKPSIVDPDMLLTPLEAKNEAKQLAQFQKLVNDKKRIEKFSNEMKEAMESEIVDKKEKEAERHEVIKLIRQAERKKIRQNEHELMQRMQKKQDLRTQLKTVANKQILLKAESAKLR